MLFRRTAARLILASLLGCLPASSVLADVADAGHDRIYTEVARRLVQAHGADRLKTLKASAILSELRPEEREVLARGHVRFQIKRTSFVTVFRSEKAAEATFWLADRGFVATGKTIDVDGTPYAGFERVFEAGEVSLGIGAFDGEAYPYFAIVRPTNGGPRVEVSNVSPSKLKTAAAAVGVEPTVDRSGKITSLPPEYQGQSLVRTSRAHTRDESLLGKLVLTEWPASPTPDQIVLTAGDDPKTGMTVQWRTASSVGGGLVALRTRAGGVPTIHPATSRPLHTPDVINDPLVHLHSVRLDRLQPDTQYEYCVGNAPEGPWTGWTSFTTAPGDQSGFSFIYIGDAQNGLEQWGSLLATIDQRHPEARFYLLPGDLVDRGLARDDWDWFFRSGQPVFSKRLLLPAIGNHELHRGQSPQLYRSFFDLPANGPATLDTGHAYAVRYGDALLVVLDSNADPAAQTRWLDETLARSNATWKFVSFHHPLYASHPKRNHDHLLKEWGPVIDKRRVDMVLQGHDHAYLRTFPMRDRQRVEADEGTYYVVSVSGSKMYEQAERDYTAVGFANTPTYQVIDIAPDGALRYRAFDADGKVRDEIRKRKSK